MAIYFIKKIPKPAIWGGELLGEYCKDNQLKGKYGQCWIFSAQKGGANQIANGCYAGMGLDQLWETKPDLFDSRFASFPVIVSLVAPMQDLSIQVHPPQEIAHEMGYATGKNEAWYFLEAKADANIVFGYRCASLAEAKALAQNGNWEELLSHMPVKQGDFVYLPAGTLHALRAGCIVYEVQQATDVTFRLYDYNRTDAMGMARELHIDQALACLRETDTMPTSEKPRQIYEGDLKTTVYIKNDSFCVKKLELNGRAEIRAEGYLLVSVVNGQGCVDGNAVEFGDHFLVPAHTIVSVAGELIMMVTCE